MNHRPHKQLLVDAQIRNAPRDTKAIKEFLVNIIGMIDMKVAVLPEGQPNPIAWYCQDKDNEGMTASAILTTSDTCLHVWDNQPVAVLHYSLYSCSDFKTGQVLDALHKQFGIISGTGRLIDRECHAPDQQFQIAFTEEGTILAA